MQLDRSPRASRLRSSVGTSTVAVVRKDAESAFLRLQLGLEPQSLRFQGGFGKLALIDLQGLELCTSVLTTCRFSQAAERL